MKVEQALAALFEGKTLRRATWPDGDHSFLICAEGAPPMVVRVSSLAAAVKYQNSQKPDWEEVADSPYREPLIRGLGSK